MRRSLHPALLLASALLAGGCFALGWDDYKEAPPGGAGSSGGSGGAGGAGSGAGGEGGAADPLPPPPVEIAGGEANPRFIALDDLYVYWSNQAAGSDIRGIRRLSRATGEVVTLAATQDRQPWEIAVSSGQVFWVDDLEGVDCADNADQDRLMKVDREDPASAVPVWLGCGSPHGVATDSDAVYWTRNGDSKVMRRLLADGTQGAIANSQGGPIGVGVDGVAVYWASYNSNLIKRYLKGADVDDVITFAASDKPTRLTLDDEAVYWIGETKISRLAKDSAGSSPEILANGFMLLRGVAVDERYLYFTDNKADQVLRMRKDGSAPPAVIAEGQDGAGGITVDAEAIYWVNGDSGQVMRQEKP